MAGQAVPVREHLEGHLAVVVHQQVARGVAVAVADTQAEPTLLDSFLATCR